MRSQARHLTPKWPPGAQIQKPIQITRPMSSSGSDCLVLMSDPLLDTGRSNNHLPAFDGITGKDLD